MNITHLFRISHATRLAIGVFCVSLILAFVTHSGRGWKRTIGSDAKGYYQYLPALVIDGDITQMPYAKKLPNGNRLNLFHYGVALLQLPFFLAAHLITLLSGAEANGYSSTYAYALFFAAAAYLGFGIYYLFLVLERHFRRAVAFLVILSLYLGTNIFYYASFEPAMSHIYSFFLISAFLYFIPGFFEMPSFVKSVRLGAILGCIVAIKPNNGIVLFYFLLYDVYSIRDIRDRIGAFIQSYKYGLTALITASLFAIPQMLYWHRVTGEFLLFSYGVKGEGFTWFKPELINILFSPQNGWMIYAPVTFLALAGVAIALYNKRVHVYGVVVVTLLAWYIFASWWAWWFGGAYGHRAFVEYYPLLALPMGLAFESILNFRKKLRWMFMGLIGLLCFVNLRMCFLYNPPWDGLGWGWDDYFTVLGKVFFVS